MTVETNTKEITPTNHNRNKERSEPIRILGNSNSHTLLKARKKSHKVRLVLVLLLNDRKI